MLIIRSILRILVVGAALVFGPACSVRSLSGPPMLQGRPFLGASMHALVESKAPAIEELDSAPFTVWAEAPATVREVVAVQDCSPTSIRCVGPSQEYTVIQTAVTDAVAGDTVIVFDKANSDPYNEPIASVAAGSAGLPITIKAEFDCVSNNGATVVGGAETPACVSVREVATNDPYIIIRGFEITGQGMTHDTDRLVLMTTGSNNSQLLNSYIHHGSFQNECVAQAASNIRMSGNRIAMCRPRATAYSTNFGPWDIQTGVNDKLSFSVQGGAAQTVTLSPTVITDSGTSQSVSATGLVLRAAASFTNNQLVGQTVFLTSGANSGASALITGNTGATDTLVMSGGWTGGVTPTGTPNYEVIAYRTAAQIGAEITAALMTGGTPPNYTGAAACLGSTCEQQIVIVSGTDSLASAIEVLDIANSAHTTLGIPLGPGELYGWGPAISGTSTDWLVEDNHIERVSDYITPGNSTRVVFRGNTAGPNDQYQSVHIDVVQPGGADQVLIEDLLAIDGKNVQHHLMHNEVASTHYIWRGVQTCRHRGSIFMGTQSGQNFLYAYNNTFWDNAAYFLGTSGGQIFSNVASMTRSLGRNNIWKNSRDAGADGVYLMTLGATATDADYDLWTATTPSLAGQAHDVNAEPLVVNAATCDFTPTALSPAKDAGGPLTTVHADDTGTGTTLKLTDARMFQDGWAGVEPDTIAVGTVTNTVQIVAIDYATGAVTIESSIPRTDGAPVWWYADSRGNIRLHGPAPDIGAVEREVTVTETPSRLRIRKPQ